MNRQKDNKKSRDSAYERALALLARREHSRKDLASKLERKGFARDEIRDALQQLIDAGYQSDSVLPRCWCEAASPMPMARFASVRNCAVTGLMTVWFSRALAAVDEDTDGPRWPALLQTALWRAGRKRLCRAWQTRPVPSATRLSRGNCPTGKPARLTDGARPDNRAACGG